jgi:hypothetical protein
MLSWAKAEAYLQASEVGPATDEYIDALCESVFNTPTSSENLPILLLALERAQRTLSRRTVALAVALSAAPTDNLAVDSLIIAYRQSQDVAFAAPSMLEALGVLALRNPLARSELSSALLRLRPDDSRYLLIKAAKIIGRLEAMQSEPVLRGKLEEFSTSPDLAVQSEAFYQLALIALADALLASDLSGLSHQLSVAHALFVRAEMTEESRDDAALFRLLIDATLTVHSLTKEAPEVPQQTLQELDHLQKSLQRLNIRIWNDYRSPMADLLATRILDIVDALQRAVLVASTADDWTNFESVLIELATLHTLIRIEVAEGTQPSRIRKALNSLAESVLAPQLGPVLHRVIGRRRLTRVIQQYQSDPAHEPEIATSLQALAQAALLSEAGSDVLNTPSYSSQLDELAKRLNTPATEILRNFLEAVGSNNVGRWIEQIGLKSASLPIDWPHLYGADPSVNDAVHHLLQGLDSQLQSYPLLKRQRLVQAIEALVSFVHQVRDTLPVYTVCSEDSGKGQDASERDLQDDLFTALRMRFQRNASYELPRIGGGRPDNGLRFEECFFPIECKAEYRSISPDHIRDNYLAQADVYAAATDRVAFLMVLDLRDVNAASHAKQAKQRRRQKQAPVHQSLYTLDEGFWVDALQLDSQLPHVQPKAVVIGLVPGNRPRPSSTTTYSARPSTK